MKKLIRDDEYNEIRKLYSLNEENFFSKFIDNVSNYFSDLKKNISGNSTKSNTNIKKGKFINPPIEDINFYKKVLKGIDAPITSENLAFFYAWRQAEGAKATYNPFNTTQKKEKSSLWNCLKKKEGKCVAGVRNYTSETDGIDATIKTLKNGHYSCIVNGLKKNIGAQKISECPDLKTWGTGGLVKQVLIKGIVKPPEISKTLVKKI